MANSKKKKSKQINKKKRNIGLTIILILLIIAAIFIGGLFYVKNYVEKKIKESTGLSQDELFDLISEIQIGEILDEDLKQECVNYPIPSSCGIIPNIQLQELCERCNALES